MVIIRQAEGTDGAELARLRWDFSSGEAHPVAETSLEFVTRFLVFWSDALESGERTVWVAEREGRLVGNVWIRQIGKVPRPGRWRAEYGYVTNVYVEPEHRGTGVGSELMRRVTEWAEAERLEFLLVWPSEESGRFYQRLGFAPCREALEYFPSAKQ